MGNKKKNTMKCDLRGRQKMKGFAGEGGNFVKLQRENIEENKKKA